jgi:hypothetical protein
VLGKSNLPDAVRVHGVHQQEGANRRELPRILTIKSLPVHRARRRRHQLWDGAIRVDSR